MSNKITVVVGAWTVQARLQSFGHVTNVDDSVTELYWKAHKWNGHVRVDEEGVTWLRGWNHDKKMRDALVVSSAL
jgi:hypothetical protein